MMGYYQKHKSDPGFKERRRAQYLKYKARGIIIGDYMHNKITEKEFDELDKKLIWQDFL